MNNNKKQAYILYHVIDLALVQRLTAIWSLEVTINYKVFTNIVKMH